MVVEVSRKAYLASIVPVMVNAILNEHQIIVDIVAFVGKGDFPRSRLGEKQRGKILAGWVSRKMRTIAQFSIKGGDLGLGGTPGAPGTSSGETVVVTGVPDNPANHPDNGLSRGSLGSFRSTGVPGTSSSLRNVEPAPQILEQRELEQQLEGMAALGGGPGFGYQGHPQPLGTPIAEMPADEPPPRPMSAEDDRDGETPTKARHERVSYVVPDFGDFSIDGTEPPNVGPKPGGSSAGGYGSQNLQGQPPQLRLPGVDGRESFDDWDVRPDSGTSHSGGINDLPSRRGHSNTSATAGPAVDDDEWAKEANMYMNLAGKLGKREG